MKVKEESEKGDLKLNIQNEYHGIQSQSFMVNIWENNGNSEKLYFGGAPKSLQMVNLAMKLKCAFSLEENLWRCSFCSLPMSMSEAFLTFLHFNKTLKKKKKEERKKSYDQARQHITKQRHYFSNKVLSSQTYVQSQVQR